MPIGQRGIKRKAPTSTKSSTQQIVKPTVKQPARPVIPSVVDSISQLTDDWDADSSSESESDTDEASNQSSRQTRSWTDIHSLPNPKFPHVTPFSLPNKLITALQSAYHFDQATPVQYQTIPYMLSNFDPIVQSSTGSGKTLAYVLPLISLLYRRHTKLKKHEVGGLILAPTHELAKQIENVIQTMLSKLNELEADEKDRTSYPNVDMKLTLLSLIGGLRDPALDLSTYQANGANIVVATPGRLEQFLKTNALNVRELTVLVLDEADQLLSTGFDQSMNHILSYLPKQRRTALFSATQQSITDQQIRRVGMKQPQYIEVSVQIKQAATQASKVAASKQSNDHTPSQPLTTLMPVLTQNTPLSLKNFYLELPVVDKFAFLLRFILSNKDKKLIIFFMTCAAVDYFADAIQNYVDEVASQPVKQTGGQRIIEHPDKPSDKQSTENQMKIIPLHGRLPGAKRTAALSLFATTHSGCVLIASDVAARGLDIVDVDVIVQFDAPNKPDFFVHRVGRTARAGRQGSALLLISPHEDVYPNFLEKQGVPIEQKTESGLIVTTDDQSVISSVTSDSVTQWLFDRCLCDRVYFEGAQSALVSFIRGYKEHELKFIFELHRLPFAELARLYGCLLFPMMSDLKHLKINYDSGIKFDAQQIAFKDPKREKQRQENEALKREKRQVEKEQRIAEQQARIKAKGTLRDQIREQRQKRKPHMQIKAEWEELAKDTRAMKKQKKGKLTKKEMDAILMGKDESDLDSSDDLSD